MIRRTLAPLLLAISLLFAGLAVAATPASAAALSMVGQSGYATFWDGCAGGTSSNPTVGYCGLTAWPIWAGQNLNTCYSVPTGANDRWSAVSNNTTRNIEVFTAGGCGGSHALIYSHTETGQLSSTYNNTISSYAWRSTSLTAAQLDSIPLDRSAFALAR